MIKSVSKLLHRVSSGFNWAFLFCLLIIPDAVAQLVPEVLSPVAESDLKQIVDIINDRYLSGYERFLEGGYSTSVTEMRDYLDLHQDARIAVLRDDSTGDILATVLIRLQEPNPSTIMLHKFVTSPLAPKEVGRYLLAFAEKWALEQNHFADEITLEAFKQADSLVRYYKKNGYSAKLRIDGQIEERLVDPEDQNRATPEFKMTNLAFIKMFKSRECILPTDSMGLGEGRLTTSK